MREPPRFSVPVKIAVAALAILLVDASILLIFGNREWHGLDTLITASTLTPLSALTWPLFETVGYIMLFGIDYARQTIWERRQRAEAQARATDERRQKEIAQIREEAREEGYKLGYDAGVTDERRRQNGVNGHNWMFGGPDDDR